jgi:hypothetical protein
VGESIRYTIKYGIVPRRVRHDGNRLHIETVAGRTAYKVVSEARTNKTMDVFFKVRDVNESWIDTESLCSLQFRQDIQRRAIHAPGGNDLRSSRPSFCV